MIQMSKEEITKMLIARIEKEIRDTPYHKGTEHHIGRLRARLARLKDALEYKPQKSGKSGGYAIKKQGDATVLLVGPPSSGKSTLLNKLTNAHSKVAPYAFTTVSVIPGMMKYKDAYIQILDVPGLIEGAETGKGRGKEVLSVARGSDLLVIISDVGRTEAIERISKSLYENGIRINTDPPRVDIEKKVSGGTVIHSNIKQEFSKETIKNIALEMGIKNAEIYIKEKLSFERLIDAFSKNRVYVPAIYIVNKIDMNQGARIKNQLLKDEEIRFISAERGDGLEKLKEEIWKMLEFVRIYLVRRDEEPSYNNPVVMREGNTISDVAHEIGEEFAEGKTRARIWGKGAKYPEQEVSLTTKVQEGMQIRFV